MCVSSFKKGFTLLSLKTRLLGEKQHRSTLPAAACYNNSTTTRRTSSSGGGGRRAPPPSRLETSTPALGFG